MRAFLPDVKRYSNSDDVLYGWTSMVFFAALGCSKRHDFSILECNSFTRSLSSQRHNVNLLTAPQRECAHSATTHSATDLVECSQRQHNRINNRIHAHSATGHSATHLAGVLTAPQLIAPQLIAPHICCGAYIRTRIVENDVCRSIKYRDELPLLK
ncbi:hypothetical protein J6590_047694 [Homalodisca vitripennis]|nr:hypothetical protein J6590_047694 [Homalodisca vitripennis]